MCRMTAATTGGANGLAEEAAEVAEPLLEALLPRQPLLL